MDYKVQILNKLLDKYEGSGHYKGGIKQNRRIALKFDKKNFPVYDIENTDVKENIHYAVKTLHQEDLIDVRWMPFEEGNILDRVFLNIENIDKAYVYSGRIPKSHKVSEALEKLQGLKEKTAYSWIASFLGSQIDEMESKKDFTRYMPKDDYIFQMLLDSLWGIYDKGEEEMLERVFSRKYLNGSKKFEKYVKSRLSTIVRDFWPGVRNIDDDEVLQNIGILKNTEELLFKGKLKINLNGNVIDFTPFVYGASLNSPMIKSLEICGASCSSVITIENKANYLEYIKTSSPDEFVMYLGGFYSPVKREFLEKLYKYILKRDIKVDFFHWGDIDLGGFNIFMQLKGIIEPLRPMNMDVSTLLKYEVFADSFDDAYGMKLQKLLQLSEYSMFYEVIKTMLKLGIKLEQEALL